MELQQKDSLLTFEMDNPFPKQYGHESFKWSAPWGASTFAHDDMSHIFAPLFHQPRVGPTCKLLQGILSNTHEANWSQAASKKKMVTIWNGTEIICNANACSKFLVPNFYIDGWTQETCDPSMMRPQEVAYFCYFILWYLLWRSQRQSKQNQLIRREAWCVGLICFYFFPFVNTGNSFFIWMTAGMTGSRRR